MQAFRRSSSVGPQCHLSGIGNLVAQHKKVIPADEVKIKSSNPRFFRVSIMSLQE